MSKPLPLDEDEDEDRAPVRAGVSSRFPAQAGGAVRAGLLVGLMFVAGCGSGKTTDHGLIGDESARDPQARTVQEDAPPADGGKDLEAYTRDLEGKTPLAVDSFEAAGLKALEYDRNPHFRNVFARVVRPVDRVYLTDRLTGKGGWYTRARLTANLPRPNTPGEQFRWVRVEMLP